jgi:hypothetical protein
MADMSLVLRNPVYFMFLILVAIGAYVTYTLNLWGPMIKMANAASQQALVEGKKRLRDFLEENPAARQAIAMTGRDEYEMKSMSPARKPNTSADGIDDEDEEI